MLVACACHYQLLLMVYGNACCAVCPCMCLSLLDQGQPCACVCVHFFAHLKQYTSALFHTRRGLRSIHFLFTWAIHYSHMPSFSISTHSQIYRPQRPLRLCLRVILASRPHSEVRHSCRVRHSRRARVRSQASQAVNG